MDYKVYRRMMDVYQVIPYGEGYLSLDYQGIHFLDVSFQEQDAIIDFYDANYGVVILEDCLLVYALKRGFRVYDLKTKKVVSELNLPDLDSSHFRGFDINDRGNCLAIIMKESYQSVVEGYFKDHFKSIRPTPDIVYFSLPYLKLTERLETHHSFDFIQYVPYKKTFLMKEENGTVYQINGKKIESLNLHCTESGFFCSKRRKQLFCLKSGGVRIYNDRGDEISYLDLVDDKTVFANTNVINFFQDKDFDPNAPEYQEVPYENVLSCSFFDERTLLVFSGDCLRQKYHIDLVDMETKECHLSICLPFAVSGIDSLKGRYLTFIRNRMYHVLEVTHDRFRNIPGSERKDQRGENQASEQSERHQ